MSRDFTPREAYAVEQNNIKQGMGDYWSFMRGLVVNYNGHSQRAFTDEEIALRQQFPIIGKLLNNFYGLYNRLLEIDGGIELLHRKDEELASYVETLKGDVNSPLIKWFNGELDERFYYCERNNELFCENVLLEAQLLTDKVWVTVYKDALGYYDDDNLTSISVPGEWLIKALKEDGWDDINEWFSEYTADDTDGIARKALAEGVILECEDKRINIARDAKLDCIVLVRALSEADVEQVELLDDLSGNDVAWGIDSEEYAWGIFIGDDLVGYCTIGGADDTGHDEYESWTYDSLCLSDVFVKEEHRGKGFASRLINEALEKCNPENKVSVFITLLDDRLSYLYEKLGFKALDNGDMVREKGKAPSLEKQISAACQPADSKAEKTPLNKELER